jgi:hypothetical protein
MRKSAVGGELKEIGTTAVSVSAQLGGYNMTA